MKENKTFVITYTKLDGESVTRNGKWVETILEQCKVLKSGLRDHIYLEQSIDMANQMGITINETDILATTSKGIVVSNKDILNHLETLKNKTQTREQKIALRRLYDQQQANN